MFKVSTLILPNWDLNVALLESMVSTVNSLEAKVIVWSVEGSCKVNYESQELRRGPLILKLTKIWAIIFGLSPHV